MVLFLVPLSMPGCASTIVSISDPKYQFIDNDLYYVSITPIRSRDYHYAFRLIVKNKTSEELEIDWDKTFYLNDEEPVSSFMFDGIAYNDRGLSIPREKIKANDIFIRTIWPNALVDRKKDWFHQPLEEGRHGIEITLIVNKKQVCKERLLLNIIIASEDNTEDSK